jgi:hypothetical protein
LGPEAVTEARWREAQNLINFDALEWVRNEDLGPSGKWIKSREEDLPKSDPGKPSVGSRRALQEVATRKFDDDFAATPTTTSGGFVDVLAVCSGWPIANADLTTAFTGAPEDTLACANPADGWRKPGWSWRMTKNIDGRRAGAQAWFEHFAMGLGGLDMKATKSDHCSVANK